MQFRRFRRVLSLGAALTLFLASCQGQRPIEYQVLITQEVTRVVIVTATPEGREATIEGDPSAPAATLNIPSASPPIPAVSTPIPPTPTLDPRPTSTVNQVIVAEQRFQNGRMFYVQPIDEIWVLFNDGDGISGTWLAQTDLWEEGMAEFDPSIQPPAGLYQPERGFGMLWRENEDLRNRLGFAIEPEGGHVTTYTYTYNGIVNANGTFVPETGTHTLISREGVTFSFDDTTSTWRISQ